MSKREVAVIGFAQETAVDDRQRNEVEFVIPVVREAIARSGMERRDIGFTISGSCDYLAGGPFTFVMGLDGVGAWPPVKESHVEMDAAWALYEAWVAIQTGDVDSAIIYGFGKASLGDLHETWTLQTDPYTVATLWPSMVDMAALQADAYLTASGKTDGDLAEVAARCRRNAQTNPHAVVAEDVSVDDLLGRPVTHRPLRDSDIAPITDGAAAIVIAAEDVAKQYCERPAWIRGIEHRVDPQHLGFRDLATAPSAKLAAEKAGATSGAIDVAEIHAQFSHEELILARRVGVGRRRGGEPVGWRADRQPHDGRRPRPDR